MFSKEGEGVVKKSGTSFMDRPPQSLFVLTTGVAEEHWTFLVSVTVGTLWDLFTS